MYYALMSPSLDNLASHIICSAYFWPLVPHHAITVVTLVNRKAASSRISCISLHAS
eukprot:COSAG01_NODE_39834_length_471_cov_1.384409_1_plen_55_part_01